MAMAGKSGCSMSTTNAYTLHLHSCRYQLLRCVFLSKLRSILRWRGRICRALNPRRPVTEPPSCTGQMGKVMWIRLLRNQIARGWNSPVRQHLVCRVGGIGWKPVIQQDNLLLGKIRNQLPLQDSALEHQAPARRNRVIVSNSIGRLHCYCGGGDA